MASSSHRSVAGPRSGNPDALLILDMISCWDFPDADRLLPQAMRITAPIARLRSRAHRHGVPIIYCNDNRGQWRSDFRQQVSLSLDAKNAARDITRVLLPCEEDYFVLKPRHSAFYATPLQLLLQTLEVRRIVLAGVTSDQCVLVTAMDARIREFEVVVPSDTCATHDALRQKCALSQFGKALEVPTPVSSAVRWNSLGRS
ncbi:MAG: cysteine hydrolase [Burkholderiales bacterium]|nr:cysteine hydrolase [Burkholderiales bacterium]